VCGFGLRLGRELEHPNVVQVLRPPLLDEVEQLEEATLGLTGEAHLTR